MTNEVGRSMVEMLGTLAVMGVLSVVGLSAFNTAMDKNKANTLIQEAQRRAVVVAGQIGFNNQTPSLAEFSPPNPTAGGTLVDVKTTGLTKQFGIQVSGVTKSVCENILRTIGESTPIRRLSLETTPTTPITTCNDTNAFLFIYNEDMTTDDKVGLPRSCRSDNDCKSICATCEIPEDEEVGICTNECEEPVKLCQANDDCNQKNECMVCGTETNMCKNGCEKVEYLENTGTGSARNWINTGIVPDTTTRWEVRIAFNNTATGKLMGSGYTNPTRFNLGIESNKFRFAFNTWFNANQNIITPDTNAHTWIMDAPSKTFTIDEYSTTTTQTFGASTFPICLFARGSSASGITETSNALVGKIYYTKIWQNGILVRDFIPVLSPESSQYAGAPCMFDKVTKKLFCNAGSGTFKTNKD